MIKRIGSANKKDQFKVHVDDIKYLRRFESPTGLAMKATAAQATTTKAYEVHHVMGEREAASGQKHYLIRWEGYEQHTWEPLENLTGCPEKIEEWVKLSHTDRTKRHAKAKRTGIVTCVEEADGAEEFAEAALVLSMVREQMFVCMDISQTEDILGEVCRRAGITPEEVAAVLMSPPCETYSVADATNQTRHNHYRDHTLP